MAETLRDVIRQITQKHLQKGNQLFGQCLTAVGWVNNTVPQADGLVELSMADVMAGGVVVGAALAGTRPMYLVRYQGFQWFNSPIIANYAGKSLDIWNIPCPIFIRSLAMEGGIGPVGGSSHHGIYYRMPGVKIAAPMTPNEYRDVYHSFMNDFCPYYVSEHRLSYDVTDDTPDIDREDPDFCLFPFSITRFAAIEAAKHENINVYPQLWISPTKIPDWQIEQLKRSKYGGIVLDDDYPNGVAKQIAYDLMHKTGKPVYVLCIEEKTAGFQPHNDNFPPTKERILEFINEKIRANL